MKQRGGPVEFEGSIENDGRVRIPHNVLEALGLARGGRVHLRLTDRRLAGVLEKKGVTHEEVDRISAMQHEPRGQVIRFLLS